MSGREHSRAQLQRKLMQRGHAEAAIEPVLEALAGQGLQSDARFTEYYVEERMRKGYGPLRIQAELRERGIGEALIERHLERDESDWRELLARVHNKKFGAKPLRDRAELAKRARFLEYRGFSSSQVSRFLHLED